MAKKIQIGIHLGMFLLLGPLIGTKAWGYFGASDLTENEDQWNKYYAQMYYNYSKDERQRLAQAVCAYNRANQDALSGFVDCASSTPRLQKPILENAEKNDPKAIVKRDHLTEEKMKEVYFVTYQEYCKSLPEGASGSKAVYCKDLATQGVQKIDSFLEKNDAQLKQEFLNDLKQRVADLKSGSAELNRYSKQAMALADCETSNIEPENIRELNKNVAKAIAQQDADQVRLNKKGKAKAMDAFLSGFDENDEKLGLDDDSKHRIYLRRAEALLKQLTQENNKNSKDPRVEEVRALLAKIPDAAKKELKKRKLSKLNQLLALFPPSLPPPVQAQSKPPGPPKSPKSEEAESPLESAEVLYNKCIQAICPKGQGEVMSYGEFYSTSRLAEDKSFNPEQLFSQVKPAWQHVKSQAENLMRAKLEHYQKQAKELALDPEKFKFPEEQRPIHHLVLLERFAFKGLLSPYAPEDRYQFADGKPTDVKDREFGVFGVDMPRDVKDGLKGLLGHPFFQRGLERLENAKEFYDKTYPGVDPIEVNKKEAAELQRMYSEIDSKKKTLVKNNLEFLNLNQTALLEKARSGKLAFEDFRSFYELSLRIQLWHEVLLHPERNSFFYKKPEVEFLTGYLKNFNPALVKEIDENIQKKKSYLNSTPGSDCLKNLALQYQLAPSEKDIQNARSVFGNPAQQVAGKILPKFSSYTQGVLKPKLDQIKLVLPKTKTQIIESFKSEMKQYGAELEKEAQAISRTAADQTGLYSYVTEKFFHSSYETQEKLDEAASRPVKKFCEQAIPSIEESSAAYNPLNNTIHVTPYELANPGIGMGILLHESGHGLFHLLGSNGVSGHSKGKYIDMKKCLTQLHSDPGSTKIYVTSVDGGSPSKSSFMEGSYAEEDGADLVSALVRQDEPSLSCSTKKDPPEGYGVYEGEMGPLDPHSTFMFRALHVEFVKNQGRLPLECKNYLKTQKDLIPLKNCGEI